VDEGFVIGQAFSSTSRRSADLAVDADENFVVAWIVTTLDGAPLQRGWCADRLDTGRRDGH